MENPTFATRWNIDEIDSNYQRWLEDRSSVESKWQYFFEGFHLANDGQESPPVRSSSVETGNKQSIETHARLYGAIYSFRDIGHTQGTFDPLCDKVEENPRLTLKRLGFEPNDLNEVHFTGNYLGGCTYVDR